MDWKKDLAASVTEGDEIRAEELAEAALASGAPPRDMLEKGAVRGIYETGRLWQEGDYFLPDVIISIEAFNKVMEMVEPLLAGDIASTKGKVVLGSVEGDAHDLGKNIVAAMLRSSLYEVIDLGIDVGPDNADRRHNAVVNVSYLFPFDFQVAAIGIYRSATPWSVTSTAIATAGPFGYRLEPRNSRRGDSLSTLDLRLGKTFKFGRYGVAAFWEMFNALNTVNYTNYQGSKQSSVFGQPRAAFDMRRQQVGFRFDL